LTSRSLAQPVEGARGTVVLGALALAVFAYAVQQTALLPALPAVQRDLHTSTAWVTWLVSGYLLVSSASTPLAGKFGDQFGKKRMLVIAMSVFFVGAVGATVAPNIATLLVARALQGVGGVTIPLSASIIRDEFPQERVRSMVGLLFAVTAVGMSCGVAAGGLIVDVASWRIMFGVAAALVAVALMLVWSAVPESPIRTPSRRDVPGAVLLTLGVLAPLLALTQSETWGWGSGRTIALFCVGALVLPIWVAVELRAEEPMLDVRMLAQRNIALTNVASAAWGFSIFGPLILIPRLVIAHGAGYGFGGTLAEGGLYLMPGFAAGLFSGPLASRLADRRGAKAALALGAGLLAAGSASLALFHDRPWQVIAGAFLVGVGWPAGSAAMANIILASVRASETAAATAVTHVLRGIGSAVGAQVGAAVLASVQIARLGVPAERAYTIMFVASAVAAALAFACSLLIVKTRARPDLAATAVVAVATEGSL
jgi:MFS family permease